MKHDNLKYTKEQKSADTLRSQVCSCQNSPTLCYIPLYVGVFILIEKVVRDELI